MDFINLHRSVLDSEEFLSATPAQRGTWLCLYRYCAGQENGGTIEASKAWSDRVWLQICAVSAREVAAKCGLWSWEDEALVVTFYNKESEATVQRLRSQASAGAHARWHRTGIPHGMPDGMPSGIPQGISGGNRVGDAKGKGKKGNEKKDTPRQADAAFGHGLGSTLPRPNGHRKPKPGSMLPSEHEPQIAARMVTVGGLKGRMPSTPWTAKEIEAFTAARLATFGEDDFNSQIEVMRRYYSAKIPRETDFRRRELLTLLNNWPGELDKARMYFRDNNDGYTTAK